MDFKTTWGHRVWGPHWPTEVSLPHLEAKRNLNQSFCVGGITGKDPALLTPSPALLARHTVALGPAVLAEIGSLQNFPSPQCAAGALRQVEDEHVSALQGGPCHLRGELIGSYSIYIKSVMSSCFLSLGEEMDLTA